MDLSIIIVNWNTRTLLDQCLQSIEANPPAGSYETWVIDNNSSDDSLAMLGDSHPPVRVIANAANTGFARANNQGMREAQGEVLLLLNSDTLVMPGAFDELFHTLRDNPRAGVVGSRLLNQDGTLQESWAAFPSLASEILGRNFRKRSRVTGQSGVFQVDWVGGACMLVRAAAVHQVGLLDEQYFMYSEEVDWCYRMRMAGWLTLYAEKAEVIHLGGGSANRFSLNQLMRLYDSKLRFFRKNYGRLPASLLRAGLILAQLLRIVRHGLTSLTRPEQAAELRGRSQSQWQLVRWLWAGSSL